MGKYSEFDKIYLSILMALITVFGVLFSHIVPPFQSPDEDHHMIRAYSLSRGEVFLFTENNESTGCMVDLSLVEFIGRYKYLQHESGNKVSRHHVESASTIRWSGREVYASIPGTGYYFPLVYAPQALGLFVGKTLGFSVYRSCLLARVVNVVASVLVLCVAFWFWPFSPFVVALLLIPMSVFQLSSASIDFFALSLTSLVMSLFMLLSSSAVVTSFSLFVVLSVLSSVVSMCRLHMIPLFCLVAYCCFRNFSFRKFAVLVLSFFGVLGWTFYAVISTVDLRVVLGVSKYDIVSYYLHSPSRFFEVFTETVLSSYNFFVRSFLGVLGWLDTSLTHGDYDLLGLSFLLVMALSFSVKSCMKSLVARSLVVFAAFISVFIVFASMLISWTPHPAVIIQGVQGRYFTLSALLVAYALSSSWEHTAAYSRRVALCINVVFVLFDSSALPLALIYRYYA